MGLFESVYKGVQVMHTADAELVMCKFEVYGFTAGTRNQLDSSYLMPKLFHQRILC